MNAIKDNKQILAIATVINIVVLWKHVSDGDTLHGIGYFLFFYVAVAAIYFFTEKIQPKNEIEVKDPKKELIVAFLFSILGIVFLTLNFMLKSNAIPESPLTKIPIGIGSIVFAMPLGIFIFLLIRRYKIMRLGFTTKPLAGVLLGPIIWALTGIFAYFFYMEGMLWDKAIEEFGGVLGIIVQGVIGAALFEEFSRFVLQSRLEKFIKTNGINILIATTIWAFMHFPVSYYKSGEVSGTLSYCIQIIPLGLVWGYMTQRTRSIVPATLAHGVNLWGFQNG